MNITFEEMFQLMNQCHDFASPLEISEKSNKSPRITGTVFTGIVPGLSSKIRKQHACVSLKILVPTSPCSSSYYFLFRFYILVLSSLIHPLFLMYFHFSICAVTHDDSKLHVFQPPQNGIQLWAF
jgi:hypothetical protein